MLPKSAEGIANLYEQSDLGAVWAWSALFAQTYLSKNLGSLLYVFVSWLSSTRTKT